jgi:hypothetical protein
MPTWQRKRGPGVIEYARLKPGRGFKPGRAALYYSQRLVVHPGLRSAVRSCIATGISLAHPQKRMLADTRSHDADSSRILAVLKTDGIAIVPKISADRVTDIRQYLSDKDVVLRDGSRIQREHVPAACTIADYPLDTVLNCPHLLSFANSSLNIRIATEYFGCLPTVSTVGIRWSFPGVRQKVTTQGFHRDTDDWHCVKFFVYLTDVDSGCGPHHYVQGSQHTRGAVFTRPIENGYVEKTFGRERITTIVGPAGTAFMGDMHGVHAGPIPSDTPRLMLEVGYTMLPVFALRYQPTSISPRPDIDRYINRLIVR